MPASRRCVGKTLQVARFFPWRYGPYIGMRNAGHGRRTRLLSFVALLFAALPAPPASAFAVPDAPVITVDAHVTGPRALGLSWDAPVSDGGAAVSRYRIQFSSDGGTSWVSAGATTQLSWSSNPFAMGAEYLLRVAAENAVGVSPWSTSSPATASDVPLLPAAVAASAGDGTVTVTWGAVPSILHRPVTAVVVTVNAVEVCSVSPLVGTCTATSLENGAAYPVRLKVLGPAGSSLSWLGSVTPVGPPSAPDLRSASVDHQRQMMRVWFNTFPQWKSSSVTVEAEVSTDAGVTWSPATVLGNLSPVMVRPNLGGLDQRVRIRLVSADGASPWSAASADMRPVSPSPAPVLVSSSPGDKKVSFQYSVAATGGLPALRYELQSSTDGGTTWVNQASDRKAASPTALGLSNGIGYQFRARTWNAAGPSPWSAPSAVLYPFDAVPAPTLALVAVSPVSSQAVWTHVADTASRAVAGYQLVDANTQLTVCSTNAATRECSVAGAGTRSLQVRALVLDGGGVQRSGSLSAVQTIVPHDPASLVSSSPSFRLLPGDGSVSVVFDSRSVPLDAAAVTSFRAYVDGRFGCQVAKRAASMCVLPSLLNGVEYSVTAVAVAGTVEGPESDPLLVTPAAWSAPAPVNPTVTVTSAGLLVQAQPPSGAPVGIVGYQLVRDGAVVATSLSRPRWVEVLASIPGTYSYEIRTIGPKGRLGAAASVSFTVMPVSGPSVSLSASRGRVEITPSGGVSPPAGSKWLVLRNNALIAEVSISDPSAPVTVPYQSAGIWVYQLKLMTPAGVSSASPAQTVEVPAV